MNETKPESVMGAVEKEPIKQEPIKEKIRRFRWRFEGREIPLGVGCAWLADPGLERDNVALLSRCYETGFRFFDTSRDYGESEIMLGGLLRQIDRKTIFLATKCDFHPERGDAFESFRRRFYESFERLGVPYIDLYQVHDTNNYEVCLPEVIPFLKARKAEGLIGAIGLGTRTLAAHLNAIACGDSESALSYMDYNLLKRSADPLIQLAKECGAAFLNASVLLFGLIKSADPMSHRVREPVYAPQRLHQEFAVRMRELCAWMNVDIVAASLQYSLLNPDIDMTLNGIRRPANLDSTIEAMRHPLHPEQWAAIEELQRTHPTLRVPDERNF